MKHRWDGKVDERYDTVSHRIGVGDYDGRGYGPRQNIQNEKTMYIELFSLIKVSISS